MPENKNNAVSSAEAFEKRIKSLEKDIKDIKKLSIANLYGKYDEDVHAEVSSSLKEDSLSNPQGLVSKYFHLIFLVFSFLILVFTFLTFAAVTGAIAGCYWGYDSIPVEYKLPIKKHDYIVNLAEKLWQKNQIPI